MRQTAPPCGVGSGLGCTNSVGDAVGALLLGDGPGELVGEPVDKLVGEFVGEAVGELVLGEGPGEPPPVFRVVPTAVKLHWLPVNPFTQAGPVMAWSVPVLNAFRYPTPSLAVLG